jgi:hypothetical protein
MGTSNHGGIRRFLLQGVLAPGCLLLAIGEGFFRSPFAGKQAAYAFDPVLGERLAPSQSGRIWLGNKAFLSPPITLDAEGFRNPPVPPTAPAILCLGSSEALGTGVSDSEVWTARLADTLTASLGRPILALNGGNPGYGPFQVSVLLDRVLAARRPELVIVRVSMGDRNFHRPDSLQVEAYRHSIERNRKVKAVTLFLPFLLDKASAQWNSIQGVFRFGGGKAVYSRENETREGAARMFAAESVWYDTMAAACGAARVPLLFAIMDPLGTEAGRELRDRFVSRYGDAGAVRVVLLDNGPFGLDQADPEDRRKAFKRAYTLGVDPHANALQHAVVARFLSAFLLNWPTSLLQPSRPGVQP